MARVITQRHFCSSYLLFAEVLEEVRRQLEWRDKGRPKAVAECLHLSSAKVLCSSVFCLPFAGLLLCTKAITLVLFHVLMLLFTYCYSHGVASANPHVILMSGSL